MAFYVLTCRYETRLYSLTDFAALWRALYSVVELSVRLSVCLSVTHWNCVQTIQQGYPKIFTDRIALASYGSYDMVGSTA